MAETHGKRLTAALRSTVSSLIFDLTKRWGLWIGGVSTAPQPSADQKPVTRAELLELLERLGKTLEQIERC